MLELHYNFAIKFCDTDTYEEMGIDTDSLYLALAEKKLSGFIRSEKKQESEMICSKDCNDSFAADAWSNLFPRKYCAIQKKNMMKVSLDCSKKNFPVASIEKGRKKQKM